MGIFKWNGSGINTSPEYTVCHNNGMDRVFQTADKEAIFVADGAAAAGGADTLKRVSKSEGNWQTENISPGIKDAVSTKFITATNEPTFVHKDGEDYFLYAGAADTDRSIAAGSAKLVRMQNFEEIKSELSTTLEYCFDINNQQLKVADFKFSQGKLGGTQPALAGTDGAKFKAVSIVAPKNEALTLTVDAWNDSSSTGLRNKKELNVTVTYKDTGGKTETVDYKIIITKKEDKSTPTPAPSTPGPTEDPRKVRWEGKLNDVCDDLVQKEERKSMKEKDGKVFSEKSKLVKKIKKL